MNAEELRIFASELEADRLTLPKWQRFKEGVLALIRRRVDERTRQLQADVDALQAGVDAANRQLARYAEQERGRESA
jgi:hypothetical protein